MAGGRNERGGDVDGTINGNNVNSKQVEGARLTANSRYAAMRAVTQTGDRMTHLCHPSHPPTLQTLATESLDRSGNEP